MGAQAPPSMLCFVAAIVTTIFSIIALALSANICSYGFCNVGYSFISAAAGIGVTAGVFGILLGILTVAWLLLSELWDVGIMRFILTIAFLITCLFSFVSAVLYLTAGTYGYFFSQRSLGIAAGVFQLLLIFLSTLSAFLCHQARGGGTAE